MTKITRIEVIDGEGRSYVNWEDDNDVSYQLQDDGRTLKVFVNKVKPKSPVEESYKRWMGQYPPTGPSVDGIDDIRWRAFQMGYNVSKEVKPEEQVSFVPKEIKELVKEGLKWCKEHPNESVEDYLTPKTPEETAQSLKEAFVKAQQTEKWKETQKKIDTTKESWMNKPVEELVEMLEKNPPDCLKFVMGKTLEDIVTRWWCDIFSTNTDWDMETSIQDLCDRIFLWLPKEQDSSGTQRIETIVAVDTHNELLQKIKSKLHNKKDT